MKKDSYQILRNAFGEDAKFKEGQLEAIESVLEKKKVLVVQQTGWGKSIVYFIATKLLRMNGSGPTIIISPLLSLMRNQLESSSKFGLSAVTINSQNNEDMDEIKNVLLQDKCDIILISPEQLSNQDRLNDWIKCIKKNIGLFVVDEAHCISDWGHDFRPDYKRIIRLIKNLPPNIPVLATTATANSRVVDDIVEQLGDVEISRGPLIRNSIQIQAIRMNSQAERLAWLGKTIPLMPGVGIVYCLTKHDAETVATWLKTKGISTACYHSSLQNELKIEIENKFNQNQIKCLVATIALGMGYDKSDISYVIHYQRPGNLVSYYQQIGRAGRQINQAFAILLNGSEDDEIQEYFIRTAFPTEREMQEIVECLSNSQSGLSNLEIQNLVNVSQSRIEKCLKYLEVHQIVSKVSSRYFRTTHMWAPDIGKSDAVTSIRRQELLDMSNFVSTEQCYMQYISDKLDDPFAGECGKCSNCLGRPIINVNIDSDEVIKAIDYLKSNNHDIEPRKMWPMGVEISSSRKIPPSYQMEFGKVLCSFGDAGWGKDISKQKYVEEQFSEEIINASAKLISNWLINDKQKLTLTYIPSIRRPELVKDFASALAEKLNLPILELLKKSNDDFPSQKNLENSRFQCENVLKSITAVNNCDVGDILLIDDMVDSRWTFTVATYLLKMNGAGKVFPFAIAKTSGSDGGD